MLHSEMTLRILASLLLGGALVAPGCGNCEDGVLTTQEIGHIDEAMGLRVPDRATRVWIVMTVESNRAIVNMRVDMPPDQLNKTLQSWAFEGAEEVGRLHVDLPRPPETRLGRDWWGAHDSQEPEREGEEWQYFRLHRKPGYDDTASAGIAVVGNIATVYLYRASSVGMYPDAFLDFLKEYPLPGDRWFPDRWQAYGGLWGVEVTH